VFQDGEKKTISPTSVGTAAACLGQLPRRTSSQTNQAWQRWPQRPNRKRLRKYDASGTGFLRFLFSNFRYSLTLFSKFFASFPHGTCTLSVSHQYLALDGIYHPLRAAIPNNSTRRLLAHMARRTGVSPSQLPRSKGLGPASNASVSRPQFGAERRFRMGYSRFSRPY
jgi:hypothetical protein